MVDMNSQGLHDVVCPVCPSISIESFMMAASPKFDPNVKLCRACGYSWKQVSPIEEGVRPGMPRGRLEHLFGRDTPAEEKETNMANDEGEAPEVPLAPTPIMKFFSYEHLPVHFQDVSKMFFDLATQIDWILPPGPEKTTALRKLLESKDCAVRAKM